MNTQTVVDLDDLTDPLTQDLLAYFWDVAVATIKDAAQKMSGYQWAIGDAALSAIPWLGHTTGSTDHGVAARLEDLARDSGVAASTLEKYRRTAYYWPHLERSRYANYMAHDRLTGLENRFEVLARLIAESGDGGPTDAQAITASKSERGDAVREISDVLDRGAPEREARPSVIEEALTALDSQVKRLQVWADQRDSYPENTQRIFLERALAIQAQVNDLVQRLQ